MILHSVESKVNKNLARFRVFTQSDVGASRLSATKHMSLFQRPANLMAAQEIENRRMPLLRHLAQIAVRAALNNHQLNVGNLFSKDLGRLHMAAPAPLMSILAPHDDQGWRFDIMDKVCGLMALPSNHVAQIALER